MAHTSSDQASAQFALNSVAFEPVVIIFFLYRKGYARIFPRIPHCDFHQTRDAVLNNQKENKVHNLGNRSLTGKVEFEYRIKAQDYVRIASIVLVGRGIHYVKTYSFINADRKPEFTMYYSSISCGIIISYGYVLMR